MLCGMAIGLAAMAQNTVKLIVKDKETQQPLTGATIRFKKTNTLTNVQGFVELKNLPNGAQSIAISFTGYETETIQFNFPLPTSDTNTVLLAMEEDELEEVIVQSTRTSRTIKNTPTRVETIDGEELDEKNNMRPANVSMLLHESTGLQVQQTSATSANASIRVQGLDGRYTQLLKDGYPNFGNFASGLSILEIPPLDLKQVEVIKGPASTLYGGGAIAGVINFISKVPQERFTGDFIINQSHIGQTNIGGYIAQQKGKVGYSFLALLNLQQEYDVDNDDFSELPESKSFTIHPKLFYNINPSTTLQLGNSFTKGSNWGGDMQVIKGKGNASHTYFEKNQTLRNTTTLEFEKKWSNKRSFKLKQSLAVFDRQIDIPGYRFDGCSTNAFTDVSFAFFKAKHTLITGGNLVWDKFTQGDGNALGAKPFTTGAYVQDTWDVTDKVKIESGLRADYVRYSNNQYATSDVFVLPRITALFKLGDKITSRVGGGLGYKTPTVFTEQTERIQYQNVLPLDGATAEKSIGTTVDINYSNRFGGVLSFSINQMFFLTNISNPLVLQSGSGGNYFFSNAGQPIVSKGFETNLKFIYKKDLKFFVGYTFTHAKATYLTSHSFLPLVPQNKLNLTLMYEKEDNFKLGLEGYLTDRQYLYNGLRTPAYWEFGFMAQKTFKQVSFYINFENFTDQRQSNYKTVSNTPHNNPSFDDIWNHTEGFVVNGGIKIKL